MSSILIFIVIVVLLIVIAIISYVQDKKRTEALQVISQKLGFLFSQDGGALSGEDLIKRFALFNMGHSHNFKNVLRKEQNDISIIQFDFRYKTGSGKNQSTYNQTVTIFKKQGAFLPHFTLGYEGFFHSVGNLFGNNDIDFTDSPEFSKIYLLKGEDESAIRSLFTENIRKFFSEKYRVNHTAFYLESYTDSLLVYMKNRMVTPETMMSSLNERVEIFQMFFKSHG